MDKKRLLELFELYYKGSSTATETHELMLLLKNLPDDELTNILSNAWDHQAKNNSFFTPGLREKILSRLHIEENVAGDVYPIESSRKRWIFKIAAAAVLVLALSMTVFVLTKREKQEVIEKDGKYFDKLYVVLTDDPEHYHSYYFDISEFYP